MVVSLFDLPLATRVFRKIAELLHVHEFIAELDVEAILASDSPGLPIA